MYTWATGIRPLFDISRIWQYLSCDRARPPFCQREVSDLINARSVEMDPQRRAQMMATANQMLLDDPPAILLHELMAVTGLIGVKDYDVQNLIVRWDRLDLE
jgi:ABC-type transport system substrate-binding protein